MDEERAAGLAVALAALAGRELDDGETRAVVERARGMDPGAANEVWQRHRRAPATVALRDYLAMTVRFVAQDPPAPGD